MTTEDKTSLLISAKKYSTIAEFQEDIDNLRYPPPKNLEKSEEEKEQEKKEAEKRKEEEDIKENLLSHWSKLLLKEPPKRRSNHTSFIHGDYLYVVGGIDITEHKQDDIYKVNFKEPNATWTKVDLMGDKLEKIAYHAGAEIDGFYYIVGGQNETLETLNTIQVFDITQETMNDKIEFDTEKFPPLESHTVNVNKENNSLIIYGGISGKELNRHIYSFDVQNKEMKNLTQNLKDEETPPPRQDHTAVIYNNALYIYGGLGLDNKIYDDMWKYDFSSNSWSEIVTEAQQKKRDKIKQKKLEQEANNEQKTTDDEEEEELDEDDDEIKDIRPKGRNGHSMVVVGDEFYIFGGKTGLIKESNDIWKFIPERNEYECVHETLLEQFTKEELSKISAENKKDEKKFRWLTRSDVEKRTNPSFNSFKTEAEIEKEKERKKKKKELEKIKNNQQSTTTGKALKSDKNKKTTKKTEKKSEKGNNKDTEGKYAEQVLCRPNVVKMRKTLIFTSNPDKIKEGLNILAQDEKEKINENIQRIKGEIPEPRDGQTACVDENNIYIFGGDRFKFPFNDLFVLNTMSLPLLPIKENKREKREKEKAKEEKEEREKMRQRQEELKEQMKQEENIVENEEEKDKKEEETKSKKEREKGDKEKDDKGDIKESKIDKKEEEKKEEEKKDEKKKEEEVKKEEVKKEEEKKEEVKKEEKKEEVKKEEKKEEVKKEEEKKEEVKKEEKKEEEVKKEEKKEEEKKEEKKEEVKKEEDELLTLEEKIVYREGEI